MRKAQKDGTGISHKPPSNLSADGMDAWYLQQKQREMELRKRRQEAEALLRGYRMSASTLPSRSSMSKGFGSPLSNVSETLDDPDCHSVYSMGNTPHRRHTMQLLASASKRGLVTEFDKEDQNGTDNTQEDDLKTPKGHHSYSNGMNYSGRVKLEEKKIEDEPGTAGRYRGRHSLPGRGFGETPLPGEEKIAPQAFLPETIWRDFISSGKFARSLYCSLSFA